MIIELYLTTREGDNIRIFENRAMREIFGYMKEDLKGG
jgi:PAS domain-containing protein